MPTAAQLLAATGVPAAPPDEEAATLPCGRLLADVLEHAHAGTLDGHERTCPDCLAAVRDEAALAEATRELAATSYDMPPDLGARVMRLVRAELRPGRTLPLGDPGEDLGVTEAAAGRALRRAVDAEPGVRARSCRIRPLENSVGAAVPGPVSVSLSVAVPYGTPIHELAHRLRQRVARAALDELGLSVRDVDVDVTGLEDGR